MTTYADMVTLLMTFFVLMFAISNVDQQKAMLFFAGLTRDGLSYDQYVSIVERFGTENEDDPFGELIPTPDPNQSADGNPELSALHEMFEQYIDDEGLGDHVTLVFNGEFLMLTLESDILFDTASAYVKPEMREVGVKLAQMLRDLQNDDKPFEIVVAGHTDNVPMNSPRFPSNWHLGNGRAASFVELLIAESELQPWYFYTTSGGEYRPIASNDTPEGRQQNRRVEVMISLAREEPVLVPDARP
jgi:chemotaxis protein MotB